MPARSSFSRKRCSPLTLDIILPCDVRNVSRFPLSVRPVPSPVTSQGRNRSKGNAWQAHSRTQADSNELSQSLQMAFSPLVENQIEGEAYHNVPPEMRLPEASFVLSSLAT